MGLGMGMQKRNPKTKLKKPVPTGTYGIGYDLTEVPDNIKERLYVELVWNFSPKLCKQEITHWDCTIPSLN